MRIIGCDLHARQQTLAVLDTTTGEVMEKTLTHSGSNVQEFYSTLPGPVRIGIEATGTMQWFLSLMRSCEYSSGGRQKFGGLSKQGNPLSRFLWCEAPAHAVRRDPELQRFYRRKLIQKGLGKAKMAAARKLGIRLWIMLRDQIDYNEFCRRGQMQQKNGDACARMPGTRYGAKSHRPID